MALGIFTGDGLDQVVHTETDRKREVKDLKAMGCAVNVMLGTEEEFDIVDEHMREGHSFRTAKKKALEAVC